MIATYLHNIVSPYADIEERKSLRVEFRPGYPEWRQSDIYPNGEVPYNWKFLTGQRGWYSPSRKGLAMLTEAVEDVRDRMDCFVGVLPRVALPDPEREGRLRNGGGAKNVTWAGWLWCDIDGGDGGPAGSSSLLSDAVQRGLPQPHMVVCSGGGLHVYWRLEKPVELATDIDRQAYKDLLKRIVLKVGGTSPAPHADPAAAEVARVLRLPDTFNLKQKDNPRPVKLVEYGPDAPAYPRAWWGAHLPALPAPKERLGASTWRDADFASMQGLVRWSHQGYPEGSRHHDLVSAAKWLVSDVGCPKNIALELLLNKAAASRGTRPITEDEIEDMIRWA